MGGGLIYPSLCLMRRWVGVFFCDIQTFSAFSQLCMPYKFRTKLSYMLPLLCLASQPVIEWSITPHLAAWWCSQPGRQLGRQKYSQLNRKNNRKLDKKIDGNLMPRWQHHTSIKGTEFKYLQSKRQKSKKKEEERLKDKS